MVKQIEYLEQTYHAVIFLLKINYMDISSSKIRQKVAEGISIEADVPASVKAYIEEKGLYL